MASEKEMKLIHGDCLEVMKSFDDNSIDSIVTDPPYGISFMGKGWDNVLPPTEIWQECLRVLKPGGYLVAMSASRTYHRLAVQLEDLGMICHPMIGWIYGSGFPKATDLSKQFDKGAGLIETNKRFNVAGQGIALNSNKKLRSDHREYVKPTGKTDLAKKWVGYKYGLQALKPALEICFVGQKPYEPIDILRNFMLDCEEKLSGDSWNTKAQQYHVDNVELISMLSDQDCLQGNTAAELVLINQELVRSLATGKVEDLKDRMVILQSGYVEHTGLSTELFYQNTLAESYCLLNMFITRMGLNQIIESKILNFSELESIYRSIIHARKLIGEKSDATNAKRLLRSHCVRLKLLINTSVTDLVTEKHVKLAQDQAVNVKLDSIAVFQKPWKCKGVKKMTDNVEKHGVGAFNIDACRVGTDKIPQHQRDLSEGHGNKLGANVKQPVLGITNYTQGRHPANLLHDGSEVVEQVFMDQGGVSNSTKALRKNRSGMGCHEQKGNTAGHGDIEGGFNDSGSASRFFNKLPITDLDVPFLYTAKPSKRERNQGLEGMEKKDPPGSKRSKPAPGRKSALGEARANHHPTVKPIALMNWLVKLVTPEGGTILDPFMGSGTTGIAAREFNFIGIELDKDYLEIAKKRINGQ